MKRILLITAFALGLAACVTGQAPGVAPVANPGPVTTGLPSVDQGIAAVQGKCGLVVEAASMASILATFAGYGGAGKILRDLAGGVCSALTKKSVVRGGGLPKYRGVTIRLSG